MNHRMKCRSRTNVMFMGTFLIKRRSKFLTAILDLHLKGSDAIAQVLPDIHACSYMFTIMDGPNVNCCVQKEIVDYTVNPKRLQPWLLFNACNSRRLQDDSSRWVGGRLSSCFNNFGLYFCLFRDACTCVYTYMHRRMFHKRSKFKRYEGNVNLQVHMRYKVVSVSILFDTYHEPNVEFLKVS